MKSFDNKEEWLLSWKVWEYGLETDNYIRCAECIDSILQITNRPDKLILTTGIKCYIELEQKQKANKIVQEQYGLGNISECDDKLISEILKIECQKKEEDISNPRLKEELINMLIVDQYYRGFGIINHLGKEGYSVHNDSLLSYNQYQLDALNILKLKEIISENGFPQKAMVGRMGLISVAMILQHSDQDIDFQKKHLPDLLKLVESGQIQRGSYAYLVDRTKVYSNELQIYGTQIIQSYDSDMKTLKPTIKPEELDKRRMKWGLMPIEKYLK